MYYKILEKISNNGSPFHQKVLRFNYDIPLEALRRALSVALSILPFEKIFVSRDNLEFDGMENKIFREYTKNSFADLLQTEDGMLLLQDENCCIKTGLFDESIKFYIRVFIENKDNISRAEIQSGNIEIYSTDKYILEAQNALNKEVEAHIIIDGSKKYLEEIYF